MTEKRPSKDAKTVLHQSVSVEIAAASGDYLATLRALRQKQATVFDTCRTSADKAVMAKALADVLSLIEAEERAQRGQSGQSPSNEASVRRSLSEAAAFRQEVPDELL